MIAVTDVEVPAVLVYTPAKPLKSNRMSRNWLRPAESPFRQSVISPYLVHSAELAGPGRADPRSIGEQYDPGPMAFTQFLIGSEKRGVGCFSQRDVCGIVSREVVAQFPNAANQRCMRITFHGKSCEPCEKLIAAISPDSLAGNQTSKRTHHLDIKQMRSDERLVAPEQIASDRIRQRAVREQFHYNGCVENDHRESRSSRTTCAGLRLVRMGLACCVRSNHSCIVGRSAARANSLLRKSERLMPSRAARDFRVPCTCSGTFRTWIIFDMSQAYKHVLRMSIAEVFQTFQPFVIKQKGTL